MTELSPEEATERLVGLAEEAKDHLACALGRMDVLKDLDVLPVVDRAKLRRAELEIRGAKQTLTVLQRRAYDRMPGRAA